VRLYFAALFLYDIAQLAFHRFEGVVDDFGQRLVRAIILLLLFGYQLMPARDRHIDPDAKIVPLLMGMIRLLDRDIASVDVVAKLFQPTSVLEHEVIDFLRFFQTTVSDLYSLLHTASTLRQGLELRKRKMRWASDPDYRSFAGQKPRYVGYLLFYPLLSLLNKR
jgi:hypothetical protein